MKIVFFSEIKWSYLRTRKQQILRRLPDDWDILYVEPVVARGGNSYRVRSDGHIKHVTVPYFKNFPQSSVRALFSLGSARWVSSRVASLWLRFVLRRHAMMNPDIVLVSNIYYGEIVDRLFPAARVVYDCNDNHMAFPFTPPWARIYSRHLQERSDIIVCSSTALIECIEPQYRNKVRIIGNGVDMELFDITNIGDEDILAGYSHPRLLYLGALSEWIDFDLLERLSRQYTTGSLILVGPVARPVTGMLDTLRRRKNVHYLGVVDHEKAGAYMAAADACLIPFQKNELTIRVNPNKLYEYLAMGCPVVSIDISPEVKALRDHIYIAENADSFIRMTDEAISGERRAGEWRDIAAENEWKYKAEEYELLLRNVHMPRQ